MISRSKSTRRVDIVLPARQDIVCKADFVQPRKGLDFVFSAVNLFLVLINHIYGTKVPCPDRFTTAISR